MSELVDRVAAAIYDSQEGRDEARAAIREVLAAMREPSGAMLQAAFGADYGRADNWRAAVDAFAREHGLETGKDDE